ncbi:acyl-CoA thioesterase [Peristeroidobacter soli]|uniref:acyl-CoA thioesterase n=1 Tax=Peristeroidobacter soli TaxID=2497877 RepID=UPI00101BDB95|nr:acyl-CoA thioesterase II [Peristeroidobacter soli]
MTGLEELVSILSVDRIEQGTFRGRQPLEKPHRVFGGQVIAQSIAAAYRTVEARTLHSLQCYFVRAGNSSLPIDFHVEALRDGKSFSVRRVLASQAGEAIFSLHCSFHEGEGGAEHQLAMPDVAPPERLPDRQQMVEKFQGRLPPVLERLLREDRPIEFRPVDLDSMVTRRMDGDGRYLWIRAKGALPDGLPLHQSILAYASDMSLIDVALHKHGRGLFDGSHQSASLDHVMWFHRPFRADEWLLYCQDSPSMAFSRGFTRGSIFSRSGALVASVSQEGLLRASRQPPAAGAH